jgi:hypothetical protein
LLTYCLNEFQVRLYNFTKNATPMLPRQAKRYPNATRKKVI